MQKVMRRTVVVLIVTIGLIGLLSTSVLLIHHINSRPIPIAEPVTFEVRKGESTETVSKRLEAARLIRSARYFSLYTRVSGVSAMLKFGEYRFEGSVTPASIVGKLQSGDVTRYQLTLTEGATVATYFDQLRSNPQLIDDLDSLAVTSLLERLGAAELTSSAEGLFLPETYQYRAGDVASSVLLRAAELMHTQLTEAWSERTDKVSVTSMYDLLKVASIVEKESGIAEDRAKISSVIHRRLDRRMRLQLDPTVIYALGEHFNGNLTKANLAIDHPFNTYKVYGLPPTPICSPSREAILAAANPVDSDYLYFVARGDGSSEFSETLRQHNDAVRKYQRGR